MLKKILDWFRKKPKPPEPPKPKLVKHKKRVKRKFLPKCYVMDKYSYTEHYAKKKAQNIKTGVSLRAYKCEYCGHWHLTHKKNKLRMH